MGLRTGHTPTNKVLNKLGEHSKVTLAQILKVMKKRMRCLRKGLRKGVARTIAKRSADKAPERLQNFSEQRQPKTFFKEYTPKCRHTRSTEQKQENSQVSCRATNGFGGKCYVQIQPDGRRDLAAQSIRIQGISQRGARMKSTIHPWAAVERGCMVTSPVIYIST